MKKIIYILIFLLGIFTVKGQSDRDKKFVSCIARAGLMEIKLGELSQTNGLAIEVKDMGKHLIDDHTKAGNDLKILADRKNISFPTILNNKQQKTYDKMAKAKGDGFDRSYMKYLKKHHKKMKREMKKEVKKGNDMDIATWAQNNLPVIQHHQDINKAACKSIHKK
jgi:putative membrane protein